MFTSITIRNVPREVHAELSARAARSGRSLQEYLLAELDELVSFPDQAELMASVAERKRRTGGRLKSDEIVADINADRQ